MLNSSIVPYRVVFLDQNEVMWCDTVLLRRHSWKWFHLLQSI